MKLSEVDKRTTEKYVLLGVQRVLEDRFKLTVVLGTLFNITLPFLPLRIGITRISVNCFTMDLF